MLYHQFSLLSPDFPESMYGIKSDSEFLLEKFEVKVLDLPKKEAKEGEKKKERVKSTGRLI